MDFVPWTLALNLINCTENFRDKLIINMKKKKKKKKNRNKKWLLFSKKTSDV